MHCMVDAKFEHILKIHAAGMYWFIAKLSTVRSNCNSSMLGMQSYMVNLRLLKGITTPQGNNQRCLKRAHALCKHYL